MTDFDTLADRIRAEAEQAARPGQRDRLAGIADEVEVLRRGGKTLGHVVDQQGRMVLDATGLHHLIGEDGDGDWGAVWENLYDLAGRLRRALCLVGDWQANGNSRPLGDPTAATWHTAARQLLAVLDGREAHDVDIKPTPTPTTDRSTR